MIKSEFVTFVKKNLVQIKMIKKTFKLYHKVRDHCHYTGTFREAANNICNLRYKIPKEISVVAHNATYDHHFINKLLEKEFEGQFECLGENSDIYYFFSTN